MKYNKGALVERNDLCGEKIVKARGEGKDGFGREKGLSNAGLLAKCSVVSVLTKPL